MATLPNPRTWVNGVDKTDATTLNLEIRDALVFLLKTPRVRAWRNGSFSLTNNTWTVVPLNAETFNTDNMHSNTTNNSRLTATTAGAYTVYYQCVFTNNTSGQRQVDILKGAAGNHASGVIQNNANADAIGGLLVTTLSGTFEVEMAAGEYLEMFALQNSGGALTIPGVAFADTFMGMYWQGKL